MAVQVTIAQATTPAPERQPLKLRLEPSQVAVVDATHARLDLVVDNRGGHEDVVVLSAAAIPPRAVSFAFDHDGFPLPQGRAVRLGMGSRIRPGAARQSVTRPFTVVATAGGLEAEIKGTLELTSRPAAITTAPVRLVPTTWSSPRTRQLPGRDRQPARRPAVGGAAVRLGRVRDGGVQVLTRPSWRCPGTGGSGVDGRGAPEARRRHLGVPTHPGHRKAGAGAVKARPSSPRSRAAIDGCGPSSWS